jgi:dipeptidase E
MRLFLASHRFGAFAGDLQRLVKPGARVAVISNALDFIAPQARETYARLVYDQLAAFGDLGLEAFDLDLRRYFEDQTELAAIVDGAELVWVTGGNVFLLRQAMRLSGFDALIHPLLAADRLAYGGYSAGACVAGPDLHGLELMDPPDQAADGYPLSQPIWEGLGLFERLIIPHYRSDSPEAPAAEAVAADLQTHGQTFETLGDADVIIRDGERTRILRRLSPNDRF